MLKTKFTQLTDPSKDDVIRTVNNLAFRILERYAGQNIEVDKDIQYENGSNYREFNIKIRIFKGADE